MQSSLARLRQETEIEAFIVFDDHKLNEQWEGLHSFDQCLQQYHADGTEAITTVSTIKPEDNATIIFTSGWSTLPPICKFS